jgi:hypothetical protein
MCNDTEVYDWQLLCRTFRAVTEVAGAGDLPKEQVFVFVT